MAENFNLIFGSNAPTTTTWSNSDYQTGWSVVGSIPPTRQQFDYLQKHNDLKAKELNDIITPINTKIQADMRQESTAYALGAFVYASSLDFGWYLECTTAGTTDSGDITLPSPLVDGGTISDGSVVWTIRKSANTQDLSNYLSLAGGAMTGNITSAVDNSALTLKGGINDNTSAFLDLCGKDHPSAKGYFFLGANDGTNSQTLLGNPNGALSWSGTSIRGGATNSYLVITGGSGANLVLHDRAETGKNGIYELFAEADTGYFRLEGHPDGYLHLTSNQYDYDLGGSAIVAESIGPNGYIKQKNGLILQWGEADPIVVGTPKEIVFPISFSATPRVFAFPYTNDNISASDYPVVITGSMAKEKFYITVNHAITAWINWFAIGY